MASESEKNIRQAGMMSGFLLRMKATIKSLVSCLRGMRILPTRFKSGSPEYPTRIAVFNASVDNFISHSRLDDRVYFKSPGCKRSEICEVGWYVKKRFCLSWHLKELKVRVRLSCKESFRCIFNGRGINIPTCWHLEFFRKGKCAMFRVDMEYAKTIGPVLDEVFKKIYGCSEDYVLYAYIPCDTSQHI
jgi:hypothetical protein